jgi:hypothetical protein
MVWLPVKKRLPRSIKIKKKGPTVRLIARKKQLGRERNKKKVAG